MAGSQITFSGQFGGPDVGTLGRSRWLGLKAAARDVELRGFPFPRLAFILRIDGSIQRFGSRGVDNLAISRQKEYLSVDIVIPLEDHERIDDAIVNAMKATPEFLRTHSKCQRIEIDYDELEITINSICEAFRAKMKTEGAG